MAVAADAGTPSGQRRAGAAATVRHLIRLAGCLVLAAGALACGAVPPLAREPVAVVDGVARIGLADLVSDPTTGLADVPMAFPARPPARLYLRAKRRDSPADRLLASLMAQGSAGNHGDLYDNRDRGHSSLHNPPLPTISVTAYGPDAQAQGLDYALNSRLRFGAITIGNSSTALKGGPAWRSLGRLAMTDGQAPLRLHALYAANHLYVYPEHNDHDPRHGDVFPAATPHVLVSQGSSGSDNRLVQALAYALAALRADTKALLRERGLVAPTLQMLLRRSMAGIETEEDYLSAAAHPSAFDGEAIALERLIRQAAALAPDAVPPMVRLHARAEPETIGMSYGDGLSERLFDTPDAVARIARGTARTRLYRLSTAGTVDPAGRALRFHWRVLRGAGVRITPLDPAGTVAEVVVPWTEPYPVPGRDDLLTHRIDVGVFADNGATLSAPAFFSVAFPPTERRVHDASGRLRSIAFDPPELADRYADPQLFPWRGWRDDFDYDAAGRLTGWTRTNHAGATRRFTAHGLRVLETDGDGRPSLAEAVRYPLRRATDRERDGRPRVQVEPAGQQFLYRYAGPDDRIGTPQLHPAR